MLALMLSLSWRCNCFVRDLPRSSSEPTFKHLICVPVYCIVLQSWFPASRQRAGVDVRRRTQGLPAVHDRVLVAAAGWSGEPAAASNRRSKGRLDRRRWISYLKLPEYSSEQILRERLLAATKEKGFHLN
jgi:hypothetical protein